MKKILATLLALLTAATMAFAVPAHPGPYKYKQPDGSVIVLELHGDEYFHWMTDASGRTVEKGADGFYRPVDPASMTRRARAAQAARAQANARRARWSSFENPPETNFGVRKILCILAEFQPETVEGRDFDGKYNVVNPHQHFSDMLNATGYNLNGTTGSVKDYFVDNSLEQYEPEFDVYGPVTLSHSESYYDENGDSEAILEAISLMSDEIDLADYDTDGDQCVDMVLFYFPGHNEAEGAPEWTIWPHQVTGRWSLDGGLYLTRYFCTSELRGDSGTDPASIGTTCHEFSHALGLPDFYDVDYETNGQNRFTTGFFDLMGSGNYNNDGRTPPALSAVERNMLGWMDYPETIATSGNYTLQGVQNNKAYRIDARQTGEYFILESRGGGKWDSYVDNMYAYGMVVYHIDKSDNTVPGSGQTAASLWNTNNINAYGGHPCYYVVPAVSRAQYTNDFPFGGYNKVNFLEPNDWNGDSAGLQLSNITYSDGTVTFQVQASGSRTVFGYVKDVYGQPLQDATVILSKAAYAFQAPSLLSTDETCTTDENGYYSFTLSTDAAQNWVVQAQMSGYVSVAYNVTASGIYTEQNFILMEPGGMPPATVKKYDESLSLYGGGGYGGGDIAVGMRYSASEIAASGAIGAEITQVSMLAWPKDESDVYLVIDIGGESVLRAKVTEQYRSGYFVTFDISDEHIVIPEGKDVFIGYGLTNVAASGDYLFAMYGPVSTSNGGGYFLTDFLNSTGWIEAHYSSGYFNFAVSAVLARTAEVDFATYGVSYVKLVDGVPQAVSAAGKTVKSVTWYVDEVAVNGSTPPAVSTLSSGAHTYKAVLQHYDGTSERVYFDVVKE